MPGKMENFGFWPSRTFASTRARQVAWPHVPGICFVSGPGAPVAVCMPGSIYLIIVRNRWLSKFDPAACVGKEPARAELSIQHEFAYLQDGG